MIRVCISEAPGYYLDNEQVMYARRCMQPWPKDRAGILGSLQDPGSCPSGGAGAQVELVAVPRTAHDVGHRRRDALKAMIDDRQQAMQLRKFAWSYAGTSGKMSWRSGKVFAVFKSMPCTADLRICGPCPNKLYLLRSRSRRPLDFSTRAQHMRLDLTDRDAVAKVGPPRYHCRQHIPV